MAYVYLVAAIAAEVVGTSLLKATDGFTRLWPTVGCLAGYVLSFVALSQAVKGVPVGVAYAMWSALGTAAIVAIGAVFLGEPITALQLVGAALVMAGVLAISLQKK